MSGYSACEENGREVTEKVITLRQCIAGQQAILVVEDSLEDYEALRRAFNKFGLSNPLYHCADGEKALDFLFRRSEFTEPEKAPRPALILLDLNLPGTDGHEVLITIKKDNTLRRIPVIILTTSSDGRDVEKCYSAGANSYVVKSVDREGFMKSMKRLAEFWFETAVVPWED